MFSTKSRSRLSCSGLTRRLEAHVKMPGEVPCLFSACPEGCSGSSACSDFFLKFLPSRRAGLGLGTQCQQGLPVAGQLQHWLGAQAVTGMQVAPLVTVPQTAVSDRMPSPSSGGCPFLAESSG